MGPQICKSLNFGNFGIPKSQNFKTPKWESRDKMHLDVGLVGNHKVYYKGEGGGFSQVQAMVNFMSLSLPLARPNTKSVPTMH